MAPRGHQFCAPKTSVLAGARTGRPEFGFRAAFFMRRKVLLLLDPGPLRVYNEHRAQGAAQFDHMRKEERT